MDPRATSRTGDEISIRSATLCRGSDLLIAEARFERQKGNQARERAAAARLSVSALRQRLARVSSMLRER